MNAPATIVSPRMAEIHAAELANAIKAANRYFEYVEALRASGGRFSRKEREALLALCDAITTALDDVGETAQVCREELGLDEDGFPLGSREGPSLGSEWPGNAVMGGYR